jgi:hypothetical protein
MPHSRRLFSVTINDNAGEFGPLVATLSGNLSVSRRRLQALINQIIQWALKDGFSFAATSFQLLYFPSKRGVPSRYIQYHKSTRLPIVPCAKYLALVPNHKLPPEPHVFKRRVECEWQLSKICWITLDRDRTAIRFRSLYGGFVCMR